MDVALHIRCISDVCGWVYKVLSSWMWLVLMVSVVVEGFGFIAQWWLWRLIFYIHVACFSSANTKVSAPCHAGYYCPSGSSIPNQIVCPEGKHCPLQSPTPQDCTAGTYVDYEGASECSICPEGKKKALREIGNTLFNNLMKGLHISLFV